MRLTRAQPDDLNVLIAKTFVIPFDSGVIVVKDWHVNNQLRESREAPSQYADELSKLKLSEHGTYQLLDNSRSTPGVLPPSIGEVSIGEDRRDKKTTSNEVVPFSNGYALWMDEWKQAMGFAITKKLKENENALKSCIKDSSADTMHGVLAYLHWLKKDRKAKDRPHWFQYVTSFVKVRHFWDHIQAAMTDDAYQQHKASADYGDFFNR